MDPNRRQGGIQQLLAAEQEAQQIVNAARNDATSVHGGCATEVVVEHDEVWWATKNKSEKGAEEEPPLPSCQRLLHFAFTGVKAFVVSTHTGKLGIALVLAVATGGLGGAAMHGDGISKSISSINKEIHLNSLA